MNNFKIGDVVERRDSHNSGGFLRTIGPGPYVVTAVSSAGGWLCINSWDDGGRDRHPWPAKRFNLVTEQDDPLPPAPESVRYNDDYPDRTAYKQTWLDIKRCTHRIYLESGQYGTGHGVGMEITPDAALQLAHDLTRMAMEIKRKEKANGS